MNENGQLTNTEEETAQSLGDSEDSVPDISCHQRTERTLLVVQQSDKASSVCELSTSSGVDPGGGRGGRLPPPITIYLGESIFSHPQSFR